MIERLDSTPTIEANPEYQLWKKRDRYVLLWLKSTLSEHGLVIVTRSTSSHIAWTTLNKTFQAQTNLTRMDMKTQL